MAYTLFEDVGIDGQQGEGEGERERERENRGARELEGRWRSSGLKPLA